VNTLLISFDDCLAELEQLGWELVKTPKNREEFVDVVKNLGESQYVVDFDFPTLLAFPPSVNIIDWVGTLVEETKLLLQDKVWLEITVRDLNNLLPSFTLNDIFPFTSREDILFLMKLYP
jgi:hypothetical protein